MLFLVISTKKKRFQKSNCKRKDPEWVYGTRGQKKPNRQKKSPVLYNKTQQKKHVIYSTRWTEKKRDFPYIFHSKICLFYATFCDHFLCLVKKKILKKKDKLTILVSFMCKKKDMIFLSLTSYYDPPQEKKYTVFHKKQHTPVEQKKNKELFFQKKHITTI